MIFELTPAFYCLCVWCNIYDLGAECNFSRSYLCHSKLRLVMEVVFCIIITVVSFPMQDSDKHHAACCIHVWHKPRGYWQSPVHDGPGAAHCGQVKPPVSSILWPWITVLDWLSPLFCLLNLKLLVTETCNFCGLSVKQPVLFMFRISDGVMHVVVLPCLSNWKATLRIS